MAVRKKRSISIPPELDAEIAAAAQDAGMSYSAWIAQTVRKEFIIQVFRKTRQHDQRQIDRAVRAQKLCERDHQGPAAETYERQV
jgi:hypothetical protein